MPRPQPVPLAVSAIIERLRAAVEAGDRAAVDGFWAGAGAVSPMIEEVPGHPQERVVTFLWRDADAAEVLLFVNRLTDERNLADSLMRRLPGSDVWWISYRMGSDWRASYCYLPRRDGERAAWKDDADQVAIRGALDSGRADPRNPDLTTNRAGAEQSVVSLPDAPFQHRYGTHQLSRRGLFGELVVPGGQRAWVHRPEPPEHAETDAPAGLPLVVLLDGEVWTGPQDVTSTIDGLTADGLLPPALYLFLDSGGGEQRWRDLGGDEGAEYLVTELIPWAREHLGVSRDAARTVVAGQSFGALTALRCGIRHPETVGALVSQSASLWREDFAAELAAAELAGLHVHLEVGTQEWVLHEPNRELAGRLDAAGARVRFVAYNGGHDYACWRGGLADGLLEVLG